MSIVERSPSFSYSADKYISPKSCLQMKISSPHSTPQSRNSLGIVSNMESSTFLGTSIVRPIVADEASNDLLQRLAGRWLRSRYLLKGNLVAIPVFGEICFFIVNCSDDLVAGSSQDLTTGTKCAPFSSKQMRNVSLDFEDITTFVGAETEVHISDPTLMERGTKYASFSVDSIHDNVKETPIVRRLGGFSKEMDALNEIMKFSIASNNALFRYKGVLLYGPPGTGKTSLASYCAHISGARFFSINGPEIISQYYGESEQALHDVFKSARLAAPSVIFIDELDAIAPTRKTGGEELSLRMVAALLKLMDEIKQMDRMLIIAATNRPDTIDPALRRPGRLDREIEIGVPSPEQRLEIIDTLLGEVAHSLSREEVHSLALVTHGFVAADLAALCNEAAMSAFRCYIKGRNMLYSPRKLDYEYKVTGVVENFDRDQEIASVQDSLPLALKKLTVSSSEALPQRLLKVTNEDFERAKMKVKPSAMREVMLELPKVSWDDVGGQANVKKQLIEAVQWPILHPDSFKRIGIRPPRGLLLIGPPGCSKTLMARAVASEAKLNFLAVKGPELFSKWVGESEKAVKSVFAKARANAPAIIFFDEIDSLAVTRGQDSDGTSVADRVLSQLLVEMDSLNQNISVTVIAATNRPDKIDPALLRPGRFDRILDVQPPNEADREDIFRIHTRTMPCGSHVCLNDLARLADGYTGADIKLVCREAALAALEESFEASEVSMENFIAGIGRVRPSNSRFYEELAVQFRRRVYGDIAMIERNTFG